MAPNRPHGTKWSRHVPLKKCVRSIAEKFYLEKCIFECEKNECKRINAKIGRFKTTQSHFSGVILIFSILQFYMHKNIRCNASSNGKPCNSTAVITFGQSSFAISVRFFGSPVTVSTLSVLEYLNSVPWFTSGSVAVFTSRLLAVSVVSTVVSGSSKIISVHKKIFKKTKNADATIYNL